MAVAKITQARVQAMKPGDMLWDTETRGFGVRLVKRERVYVLKYRFKGRLRWYSIGRHGSLWTPSLARREALRLLHMVHVERIDPAADRDATKREAPFANFAERFLGEYAERKVKKQTFYEYKRQIEKYFIPAFGHLRVSAITRSDVEKLHQSKRSTPLQANRLLDTLSSMFTIAERWGLRPTGSNPARSIQRYKETKRERLITPAELAKLGEALVQAEHGYTDEQWSAFSKENRPPRKSAEDPRAIAAIRLLAFTGARRNEILSLEWKHVDLKRRVARLTDSKTGARNLILSEPAIAILQSLPRQKDNPWVLPGDRSDSYFIGVAHPWERIRAAAGLNDVRLHDLRHCFASTAVSAGESLYTTGKPLGHRIPNTTQRYAHLADDPVRAVADRTGRFINDAMNGGGV